MKIAIAKSLSDTAVVAAGMLVCALVFTIVAGEFTLTHQYAKYLLSILGAYFAVNFILQLITSRNKATNGNGSA